MAMFWVFSFLMYSSPLNLSMAPTTVTPVSLPAKAILSFSSGRNRPS